MQIVKVCQSCGREFVARTSVTACCSDPCAKKYYKEKKRQEKIASANLKTEFQRKPELFITEEQIRVIQAKEMLNLNEAALLLDVSPLTLRRWVLSGKRQSVKVGRKHLFERVKLLATTN
jgi:hypothetical protein